MANTASSQKVKLRMSKPSALKPPKAEDKAIDLLIDQLAPESLWIADEHPLSLNHLKTLALNKIAFLTNRIDQHTNASKAGIDSLFSDMTLTTLNQQPNHIFFRTAKERALVHRVINQACDTLPTGGHLFLSGFKDEGIKTHISRAEKRFGSKAQISRHKNQLYIASIEKSSAIGEPLIDQDYETLREIKHENLTFWSKPGLYGWDKIDKGSEFLIDYLASTKTTLLGKQILDLGCGYGFLSIKAAGLGATRLVATDNCAAALVACEKNLESIEIPASVIPSDAGNEISEKFDCILCNPPFHRGFSTTGALHKHFIQQTKRLLGSNGKALFVVTQFLNIETTAEQNGLLTTELARSSSFKIIEFTHQH